MTPTVMPTVAFWSSFSLVDMFVLWCNDGELLFDGGSFIRSFVRG